MGEQAKTIEENRRRPLKEGRRNVPKASCSLLMGREAGKKEEREERVGEAEEGKIGGKEGSRKENAGA